MSKSKKHRRSRESSDGVTSLTSTARRLCKKWGECQRELRFGVHGWPTASSSKYFGDAVGDAYAVVKELDPLIKSIPVRRSSHTDAQPSEKKLLKVRVPHLKTEFRGDSQFAEELYSIDALHVARAIRGPHIGALGETPHMPIELYDVLFCHFVYRGMRWRSSGKKVDVGDLHMALSITRDRYNDLLDKALLWIAARLPLEICGHKRPENSGGTGYTGIQEGIGMAKSSISRSKLISKISPRNETAVEFNTTNSPPFFVGRDSSMSHCGGN